MREPVFTGSPPGSADEINALIHTLHRSVQRLEELTAGEVDAVVGPQGQTYLLSQACASP